jgi:hypothetical protein
MALKIPSKLEHWTKARADHFAARSRTIHDRYVAGEKAAVLADEYKIGRNGVYRIVEREKRRIKRAAGLNPWL